MINMGLYKEGTSPQIDLALKAYPKLQEFLRQKINEQVTLSQSFDELAYLLKSLEN